MAKVQDPLFDKDIVALGYVKEVSGDGDKARVEPEAADAGASAQARSSRRRSPKRPRRPAPAR